VSVDTHFIVLVVHKQATIIRGDGFGLGNSDALIMGILPGEEAVNVLLAMQGMIGVVAGAPGGC
jgi:hypothetical protein